MGRKRGREENCSFCGASNKEVGPLVEGQNLQIDEENSASVYICNDCADNCKKIFESQNTFAKVDFDDYKKSIPTPRKIVDHLNQHIIGQDLAKRNIAVAYHDHHIRIYSKHHTDSDDGIELEKSNILLIGPTGCGKTALCQALAKLVKVPFAIGDATTVTEAGYVGEDVENLLLKLIRAAEFDIPLAERGILMIDEIDKISKSSKNVSITRDVSGEGVQQSLLKMLEGSTMSVPPAGGRKHPEQNFIQIDTTNILFICAGAFAGIEKIINKRMNKSTIGFNRKQEVKSESDWILEYLTSDDLIEFGMIPEFVGRMPVVAPFKELSVDDLCVVLTEPKNSLLKQQQKIVSFYGHKLKFTDGAIEEIARKAVAKNTGARGLKSVVEELMLPLKYNLPEHADHNIEITREMVQGKENLFPDSNSEAA